MIGPFEGYRRLRQESKDWTILVRVREFTVTTTSEARVQTQIRFHYLISIVVLALGVHSDSAARRAVEVMDVELIARLEKAVASGADAKEAEGGNSGGGRCFHIKWMSMAFVSVVC